MTEKVQLSPVDGVEVTVVMDGSIDILAAGSDVARRPAWQWDWTEQDQLRAEHGYSLGPSLLLDDSVLVTGQVERVTEFEKGFSLQYARSETGWEPDTWIWDDQAVVIHVRGRGLVVLSSCSHAGVINVLHHARRVTGVDKILGFIGGLHLTGGLFEPIIGNTVDELVSLSPDVVVPGHCTGWKAVHAVAAALPSAYIASNVGTTFRFFAQEPSGEETQPQAS